ncbi:MAG: hypothetical protein V2B19_22800 [Pseudomonadota bacterium]
MDTDRTRSLITQGTGNQAKKRGRETGKAALIIDSANPSGGQVTPRCFWKPGKLFER